MPDKVPIEFLEVSLWLWHRWIIVNIFSNYLKSVSGGLIKVDRHICNLRGEKFWVEGDQFKSMTSTDLSWPFTFASQLSLGKPDPHCSPHWHQNLKLTQKGSGKHQTDEIYFGDRLNIFQTRNWKNNVRSNSKDFINSQIHVLNFWIPTLVWIILRLGGGKREYIQSPDDSGFYTTIPSHTPWQKWWWSLEWSAIFTCASRQIEIYPDSG